MSSLLKKLAGVARLGFGADDGALAIGSTTQLSTSDLSATRAALEAEIDEVQLLHDAAHQKSERRGGARLRLDLLRGQAYAVAFHQRSQLTRQAASKIREAKIREHKRVSQQLSAARERVAAQRVRLDALLSKFEGSHPKDSNVAGSAAAEAGALAAAWAEASEAGRVEEAQKISAEIERAARDRLERERVEHVASTARDLRHLALHQRAEAVQAELDVAIGDESTARKLLADIEVDLGMLDADLANVAALEAEIRVCGLAFGTPRERATRCQFFIGQSPELAIALRGFGGEPAVWGAVEISRAAKMCFVESLRDVPSLDEVHRLPADDPRRRGLAGSA